MIETAGWIARALYSTSTLLAAGFALLCLFSILDDRRTTATLQKWCVRLSIIGLIIPLAWAATLVAELGGEWSATLDTYYYQIIWSGPAVELMLWRSLAFIGLICWSKFATHGWLGILSAVAATFSFSRYGHSLSDPTVVRSLLLTLHLSVIAWWFAVVPTLLWLYKYQPNRAPKLGTRFGAQAKYAVLIALICGIALSGLQLASIQWSLQNSYTQALLIKLAFVTAILCIAAFNYMRAFHPSYTNSSSLEKKIVSILRLDLVLFLFVVAISTWLTGPASNS